MLVPYTNCVNIMSIDPASGSMGLTLSEYDLDTHQFHLIESSTINTDRLLSSAIIDTYSTVSPNFIRLHLIAKLLEKKIREYDPHILVHEAAYCNPRLVTAFRSLTRFESMIQMLTLSMPYALPVKVIEATKIKKEVGAKGGDKNLVKRGILRLIDDGAIIPHHVNINTLDEHAIDSIAIGYTYACELKQNIEDGYYLWE
jgi:Holliday junction resolvasome RuvABC endonuclease subunit